MKLNPICIPVKYPAVTIPWNPWVHLLAVIRTGVVKAEWPR